MSGVGSMGHAVRGVPGRLRDRGRFSTPRLQLRGSYTIDCLCLVVVYYAAAHLGYAFGFSGAVAAIVWLPVGVGIAFLYRFGLRLWPAVVVGDLLVNNYMALPVGSAVGQSFGNLLEVLVAVLLLRRFTPRNAPLATTSGIVGLCLAVTAGTMVSATIGSLSLFLGHVISASSIRHVWRTWWLGDFCGALIVLPLALAFSPATPRHWIRGRGAEATLLLVSLIGLNLVALQLGRPFSYLAFPALIWAALRFGPRGGALAMTITAAFVIWGTTHYHGPFAVSSIDDSLLDTQAYLAVAAMTTLAVGALACEREQLAKRLRASRTRIVVAADEERRRLERNLHDGAQGRLVVLAAHLALAAQQARRAPDTAAQSFESAQSELLVAIDELRELVHGIHPAALRQFGLARAIEIVAAQSSTPIELIELPRARLDKTAEATAYYVVLEAVTNARRHAHASSIRVRVHLGARNLELEVEDDGLGGAVETNDLGLQGLRDRVEAVGGEFSVDSVRDAGTRVSAVIPATIVANGR